MSIVKKLIDSRRELIHSNGLRQVRRSNDAAEGGCGVIGVASSVPVKGKHFLTSLIQMRNRGNGKGGGVAISGLDPEQLGVSPEVLRDCYIVQVAYLDASVREEVEEKHIHRVYRVVSSHRVETIEDYAPIGLEVRPPELYRYYCKVRDDVREAFVMRHGLAGVPQIKVDDEIVFRTTYLLNSEYYASLGEKRAFVMSHGKNLLVFKLVGYAHQVIQYYKLENFSAHVWIGHHRYPTKGTVWHPGGAHPFIGLHEALVHNGDFSNYHSIVEYLAERNVHPLFLTDTEVAAYLFDLWSRVYDYPLEYICEALAPTTERDFGFLPYEKQGIYRRLQSSHIHGSPDGPWFFIVARYLPSEQRSELVGITDTSMLRPQVFALQQEEEAIGLVASERQAIDAFLASLSSEDHRFYPKADKYWVARGGSYTDGGAFVFQIDFSKNRPTLRCYNKFGELIGVEKQPFNFDDDVKPYLRELLGVRFGALEAYVMQSHGFVEMCEAIRESPPLRIPETIDLIDALTLLLDRLHLMPGFHEGQVRGTIEGTLFALMRSLPSIGDNSSTGVVVDFLTRGKLRGPSFEGQKLFMDASKFPAEGPDSAARFLVEAYSHGWKHIYTFDWRGQRFCCSGLGPRSDDLRVDVYGNPGDYLASGLDGAHVYVHASAQDQVGQIMRRGRLVIYGDVGQAFLYGAKGGDVFVLGSTAGRPLINAVGKPRVVINGSCLDYLSESFMAGDPLKGGGFVIVNGIEFDGKGKPRLMRTPFPGSNLFSLASGGAIYLNDPWRTIDEQQLNGGKIDSIDSADKELLRRYLQVNKELFGLNIVLDDENDADSRSIIAKFVKVRPLEIGVLK